jgi:hypothetical protein
MEPQGFYYFWIVAECGPPAFPFENFKVAAPQYLIE